MDAEASAQLVATLKAHQASKDAVPIAETHMLLGQAVNQTKLREGKRGLSVISEICVNTHKKFYKLYDVVTVKPQILTDARLKSCLCPRLSYIWGCVLMAYSSALMAENKWNGRSLLVRKELGQWYVSSLPRTMTYRCHRRCVRIPLLLSRQRRAVGHQNTSPYVR